MQPVPSTQDPTFSFVNTWIEGLLARWPEKDVKRVLSERVPAFVDRVLREIDSRRTNRVQIAQLVNTLYEDKCFSRFLYNADSGAFYEVQSNGQLQRTIMKKLKCVRTNGYNRWNRTATESKQYMNNSISTHVPENRKYATSKSTVCSGLK